MGLIKDGRARELGKPENVEELIKILERYDGKTKLMVRNGPIPRIFEYFIDGRIFIELDM